MLKIDLHGFTYAKVNGSRITDIDLQKKMRLVQRQQQYSSLNEQELKDLQEKFSISWFKWETALASMQNSSNNYTPSVNYALAFSRIENHYFINKGFLKEENYILKNVVKLKDIPGIIIQGRYDMVCPPNSAYKLHDAWSKSELKIMDFSGHAMSEPKITQELIKATEKFKKL